eukprot:g1924.t1
MYGFRKPLEVEDMWPIAREDDVHQTFPQLSALWEKEKKKGSKASLFKIIFTYFRKQLIIIGILSFFSRAGALVQPWLLQQFLIWFVNPFGTDTEGYLWALAFFAVPFLSATLDAASSHRSTKGVLQIRGALARMIYEKSLNVSSTTKIDVPEGKKKKGKEDKEKAKLEKELKKAKTQKQLERALSKAQAKKDAQDNTATTGKTVNLMSVDAEKLAMSFLIMPQAIMVPAQVVVNIYLIYTTMKAATFVGLAGFFFFIPITIAAMIRQVRFSRQQSELADARLKITNEILQGVRIVKFYAWEKSFLKRVGNIRDLEVSKVFGVVMSFQGVLATFNLIPIVIPLVTFIFYDQVYGGLNAITIFKTMAYFQTLQLPLIFVPIVLSQLGIGLVSARRIQHFLTLPELDPNAVQSEPIPSENGVAPVRLSARGSFTYDETAPKPDDSKALVPIRTFRLENLNFKAAPGKLTAVVGNVGSGKSSLLLTLLGEMKPVPELTAPNEVHCSGAVGYVAQRAWIRTETIRANILFGLPYEHLRYQQTVQVCALTKDFESLPNGDLTEIGDRGINLSGGQKQRIAIARAVYSRLSIYLFDDPLSAVDANVGEHLMQQCFLQELAGTTRVLVMNQLHFLPSCDYVYVLDAGMVVAEGTYDDLKKNSLYFQALMASHSKELTAGSNNRGGSRNGAGGNVARDSLVEEEGSVRWWNSPSAQVLTDQREEEEPDSKESDETVGKDARDSKETVDSGSLVDEGEAVEVAVSSPPAAEQADDEPPSPKAIQPAQSSPRKSRLDVALQDAKLELGASGPLITPNIASPSPMALEELRTPIVPMEETQGGKEVKKTAGHAPQAQLEEEEVGNGTVGASLYLKHFKAMGPWSFMFFFWALIAQAGVTGSAFILSWWTSDKFNQSNMWYLMVYGIVGITGGLLIVVRGFSFALGTRRSCRSYHNDLFYRMMKAPSAFYDVTPVGRVLNRFTKDLNDIDSQLPRMLQSVFNMGFAMLGSLVSTAIVTPIFLVAMAVVIGLFTLLQRYYSRSCTQLKRIESVSRSPVYNLFSETLLGMSTIRAFRVTPRFKEMNSNLLNINGQAFYSVRMVLQWASVRIGLLNAILLFCAALFTAFGKGTSSPGNAAVAIYFVLSIGPIMGFFINNWTELENVMNAVERVDFYTKNITQEADWDHNDVDVPEDWPARGEIEFKNLEFSYREGLEPVIKDFNAKVESLESVGVAGRTGSGKSSLMLCILRMYELTKGQILIDGLDIAKLGLHTLRRALAIIPQEAVIFSGSVRFNLDPFDEYSDDECWNSLRHVQLAAFVEHTLGGLSGSIKEFGSNLSVGQRQLLCIARAILRKPKILLMDEATSSVDTTTDALIQTAVRSQFKHCTMLTIAHRLNTIMDSSRVMVLDHGRLVEYDQPWTLVEQPQGLLKSMYKAMVSAHEAPKAFKFPQ